MNRQMRWLAVLGLFALAGASCGKADPCPGGNCGTGGGAGGGTGGGTVACSASSCEGCCDSSGVCQSGTTASACGYGKSCAVCAGTQACAGVSAPTCTDTTCTGCSDSTGACITALTDSKCGKGGASCFSCAESGATCNTTNGACTGGVCGGCRDTSGVCQSGNTKGACGTGGFACARCGAGQICMDAQCVTGGGAGGGAGGSGGSGGGAAGGSAGGSTDVIPSPGTAMGAEWTDIEPNDRPSQAVPVGILSTVWAGFMMPYTTINSATDKDYFVFRTGNATQLMTSNLLLCWSGMFNLLDMSLYAVDAQNHQGAMVANWAATTAGCETAFMGNAAAAGLMPDTVYLLEVRAAPGAMTPTAYGA